MGSAKHVDFHCHLDLHADMAGAFEKCERAKCLTLTVTTTPKAFRRNAEYASGKEYVFAALGLHPQLVEKRGDEISLFEELSETTRYIGEIGLDAGRRYYRSFERQKEVFDRALRICATQRDKVVSVHSVRCARLVLDALEAREACRGNIIVLHWFSATGPEIRRAIDLGCWFSVNEQMLLTKPGKTLVESAPKGRILTETDAPFLQTAGEPIEAGDVDKATRGIASLWRLEHSRAQELIATNARRALSC